MDPVFQPPEWTSVSATVQSLHYGAIRIGKALARSLALLPEVAGQQALSLLTPQNLWTTAVILAFWIFASVVGGPVGLAVNGVLIALALYHIPEVAKELGTLLKDGIRQAAEAKSEADLDVAAKTLATLLSTAGIEALQVFVTHRLFLAAKPQILKRFKLPKELEAEYQRARATTRGKRELAERAKAEERASSKVKRVASAAATLAAAGGVKPAADIAKNALPSVGIFAFGALGVGSVLAVVALANGERKRER